MYKFVVGGRQSISLRKQTCLVVYNIIIIANLNEIEFLISSGNMYMYII